MMNADLPLDQLLCEIHGMEREACIEALMHFQHLHLDFTAGYLTEMSTDRLRHVLVAALITVRGRRSA